MTSIKLTHSTSIYYVPITYKPLCQALLRYLHTSMSHRYTQCVGYANNRKGNFNK